MPQFRPTVMSTACRLACLALAALHGAATAADEPEKAEKAAPPAEAATDGKLSSTVLKEVVVTAQKRRQSVNTVPMSITAVSGEQLAEQGITSVADLQKVVSGFRYVESYFATPVYYIRGVGFNETSIGSAPNVSVYVDEVPLPFPIMTLGAGLDVERVEVLKGPQGTLFGQNSTGGAINYIAAKPTKTLQSAIDLTYGSYETRGVGGYVSGPLGETLRARLAFKSDRSGPWQQSLTSSNELGRKNKDNLRLLLDWQPLDRLTVATNINTYRDRSDGLANQYIGFSFVSAPGSALVPQPYRTLTQTYPLAGEANRLADWGPGTPKRDIRLSQQSVRADYDLGESRRLTYIVSHADFKMNNFADADGVNYNTSQANNTGDISSLTQEVRLSGSAAEGRAKWIVGANSDRSTVEQIDYLTFDYASNVYAGGLANVFQATNNLSNQRFKTRSVFANLDYDLNESLVGHAAARYTTSNVRYAGCTADTGDGRAAAFFNFLVPLVSGGAVNPAATAGNCVTVVNGLSGQVNKELDENNVSWRLGVDWKLSPGSMVYGNVSRGYKGGSFPVVSGSSADQFNPVTQESLDAYEIGFKSTLLERTLQLNGALFHYDYRNKQVRGKLRVPVFNFLDALVNVPESTVDGAELQATWRPLPGLTTMLGATYLDTAIRGTFTNANDLGVVGNHSGEPFPNTPKLMGNADVQYLWSLDSGHSLSVGGNVAYQRATYSGFGQLPQFRIDGYSTLDLRAGLESPDGKWRLNLGVQNVADKYYWRNVSRVTDTIVRIPGTPRTWSATLHYRFF